VKAGKIYKIELQIDLRHDKYSSEAKCIKTCIKAKIIGIFNGSIYILKIKR